MKKNSAGIERLTMRKNTRTKSMVTKVFNIVPVPVVLFLENLLNCLHQVACALVMSGENLDNHIDVKNILVEMATYFQVQDDYLDCFGEPKKIGKIGTDIEDFKCSWFVVKAWERCNEEQKKVLHVFVGFELIAMVQISLAYTNPIDVIMTLKMSTMDALMRRQMGVLLWLTVLH
ncbi:hypothetical protein L1049_002322 [Liquidambar formosana]|uniref:Uncharacterized protein n=1 Tax=Liquidambar formosana TaxID=63359 RepID=A0AAP0NHJ2_LIQFO